MIPRQGGSASTRAGLMRPSTDGKQRHWQGQCVRFGHSFYFVARLIAHELGRAYDHNNRWLGTFGVKVLSRRKTKEYYAMGWENLWARQPMNPDGARIAMIVRFTCVITAAISQAACHGGSQGRGALEPCPRSPANATLPNQIHARYAPFSVRLPDGFSESRAQRDSPRDGQGWVSPGGLVVSYRLHAEPVAMREVWSGDYQAIDCSERIGGRIAIIQMVYSESTTASGQ
jgi:hypothetical protein